MPKILILQFSLKFVGWQARVGWFVIGCVARVQVACASVLWLLRAPNLGSLYRRGTDRARVKEINQRWKDKQPRLSDYFEKLSE